MNYYDIEKIYDEMEQYLIDNIKRNLTSDLSSFHLKEEKKLGFEWEAWQTAKLRELKRYRNQNKNIMHKYINNIDSDVADVLRREYLQGKKSAYKGYKKALKKGYKSSVKVKDSFFKVNDRKIDALIKAVNNDFKRANQAVLRRTNDTYRQVIHEASMYNTTGVMTGEQAIRKAITDFEQRGINSIEYSNGARHKISNYASMAIRTASTRAYLAGNGEFRKKIGQTLVIVSKHGTACELCQPFEHKVLIDDVYSGGSKKDGKYMLLSTAMKQGLYHPNCRHALGTYYPELGKKESEAITTEVEKEEKAATPNNVDSALKKMGQFADNIAVKGITNVNNLNEYNKTMTELTRKYPTRKLKTINTNLRKQSAMASANFQSMKLKKDYFNLKEFEKEDHWSNLVDKNLRTIKDGLENLKDKWEELKKDYNVEKTLKELERAKAEWTENKKYFRHNVIYKGMEIKSVTTHEYGHIIADQYIGQINKKAANPNFDYNINNEPYKIAIKIKSAYNTSLRNGDIYNISKYASKNEKEFFAETFAIYDIGKEKLPEYIVEVIEEVIEYGKKTM